MGMESIEELFEHELRDMLGASRSSESDRTSASSCAPETSGGGVAEEVDVDLAHALHDGTRRSVRQSCSRGQHRRRQRAEAAGLRDSDG